MSGEHQVAFVRFHDAVHGAHDAKSLRFAMQRLADIGLSNFTYQCTGTRFSFLTNYPEEWIAHYLSNDYKTFDPLVQDIHDDEIILWDRSLFQHNKYTKKLISEATDFGLAGGVTIPLPTIMGVKAGVTFAGADIKVSQQLNFQILSQLAKCVATFHVHMKAKRIDPGHTDQLLTQREREFLLWTANGKSFVEIADITGCSIRNISHYSENVKAKLNASSLAQAVFAALRMREISLE